jgi:hypothetical protein
LGRRIHDCIVGAENDLGINGQDGFERHDRRDLGQVREHIASSAQGNDLVDDMPAADRVERLIVELHEDRNGSRPFVLLAERNKSSIELICRRRRHIECSGDLSDAAHCLGNVSDLKRRDHHDPQSESAYSRNQVIRRTRCPGQHHVRLQCQQLFEVHPPGVTNPGQLTGLGRVVTVLHRTDQPVASAGTVDQFGQMWRERNDARRIGRRRNLTEDQQCR